MTTAAKISGDLRVAGNLTVDGSIPGVARTDIDQTANAIFPVSMLDARVWNALNTPLPVTSAADDIGLYGTFATGSIYMSTGDVKTLTVTRYARIPIIVPAEYDAGETLTLRLSAGMETTVSDGTATVDVEAYKSDRETGISADICATAAQSINSTTFANKDFTITPTGLTAGDVLDVRLTLAVVDGATGTAVIATIGAIEILADIRG